MSSGRRWSDAGVILCNCPDFIPEPEPRPGWRAGAEEREGGHSSHIGHSPVTTAGVRPVASNGDVVSAQSAPSSHLAVQYTQLSSVCQVKAEATDYLRGRGRALKIDLIHRKWSHVT